MSLLSKESRRRQSLLEVDTLLNELDQWYADWTGRDVHEDGSMRGQYRTQLDAVNTEVKAAATALRAGVASTSVAGDAGAVYGELARVDREILWVWRVWYFFRDKFEQRQDPRYADVLRAADEVVWSCHRPFFPAQVKQVSTPAPLPYIKADFSPSTLRQDQRHALDRKDSDFLIVKEAFRSLPVPVVALPMTAVNNPWALVLVGHEAGHIVEPMVETDFNAAFGDTLRRAIERAGGSEEDQETWSGWSDEIFADLYSILTMGPWAIWVMSQFEAAEDETSGARRFVYPAPAIRLELMAAVAARFGMTAEIPRTPALPEDSARDQAYIPPVAEAIVTMAAIQSLATTLDFSRARYEPGDAAGAIGEVAQWSRHFGAAKAGLPATGHVRSARMATAGAAKAWSETVFLNGDDEQRRDLRERIVSRVAAAGPKGVRSALSVVRATVAPGQSLLRAIERADRIVEEAHASSA